MVLEDDADSPGGGRQRDARLRIEQHAAVQNDAAFVGLLESGDARRVMLLPDPDAPSSPSAWPPVGECGGQFEAGVPFADVDGQIRARDRRRRSPPAWRKPVRRRRRPGHAPRVAPIMQRGDGSQRQRGGEDHPEHGAVEVARFGGEEDRDRHRLGAARDVSGDHQRCAELAERAGKRQHRPGQIPGRASGNRTARKVRHSPAPSVRAAPSRLGLTCSKAPSAVRYISGNATTVAEMTVAGQEKTIVRPMDSSSAADGALASEDQQQEEADHGRRENQRQRQDAVDDASGAASPAAERPRRGDSENERQRGSRGGRFERDPETGSRSRPRGSRGPRTSARGGSGEDTP